MRAAIQFVCSLAQLRSSFSSNGPSSTKGERVGKIASEPVVQLSHEKSITMEHTGPRSRNTFIHHVQSVRSRPRIANDSNGATGLCEQPL
jgi:hypothetical protein